MWIWKPAPLQDWESYKVLNGWTILPNSEICVRIQLHVKPENITCPYWFECNCEAWSGASILICNELTSWLPRIHSPVTGKSFSLELSNPYFLLTTENLAACSCYLSLLNMNLPLKDEPNNWSWSIAWPCSESDAPVCLLRAALLQSHSVLCKWSRNKDKSLNAQLRTSLSLFPSPRFGRPPTKIRTLGPRPTSFLACS